VWHDDAMPRLSDPVEAARILARGEVVAFPTETVYGLGASVSHPEAIARIFALKGRPDARPLTLHVSDPDALARWGHAVPAVAYELARRFWPGPLTLVVRRGQGIPDVAVGGGDTVGLRAPDHPQALAMLHALAALDVDGGAVPAPSANRFGESPPVQVEEVLATFRDLPVLDGGRCRIGVASTVLSLVGRPRILRAGSLTAALLAEVLGDSAAARRRRPRPTTCTGARDVRGRSRRRPLRRRSRCPGRPATRRPA
jgi:L-threonylcarbamoyladenylate synthase